MARAVISDPKRRAALEPIYDTEPHTGASVEVFYADRVLAKSFGTSAGWFWWTCRRGLLPHDRPTGPFPNSYLAYRELRDANALQIIASLLPHCFQRVALWKHRSTSWEKRQDFQMITGAPGEIRTPDPQIRSLVL
jgi:hypothetical protein